MRSAPRSTGPPSVPRRTTVLVDGLNFHCGVARLRAFEAAVVVSNDSDLTTALEIVRDELRLAVGVINPQPAKQVHELLAAASFSRTIRRADVLAAILPEVVQSSIGPVFRPRGW